MGVLESTLAGGIIGGQADWLGGRMDSWFGVDAPPESDPGIKAAAIRASKIGNDQFDFMKDEYGANKTRLAGMDQTNQGVVDSQLGMSQDSLNRSTGEWDRYKTTYQPVQDKMVSDAMTIDSAANQEKAAATAGTQVKDSFANAQAQKVRQLASMGINPNSGVSRDSLNTNAMTQAADEAVAMNNARYVVRDKGIAMRSNVAQFGQGVADQSMRLGQQAVNTGTNAVRLNNVGFDNSLKNTGVMTGAFDAATGGNKTGADILNRDYDNKMRGYEADQGAKGGMAGAIGGVVGMAGAKLLSSKKLKTGGKPVSDEKNLQGMKATAIRNWKYKKGVADEGAHVGAYAEDMQKNFGNKVAPGGKAIDVVSALGVNMSAIRGLAKQVDKLSVKVDKLARSA